MLAIVLPIQLYTHVDIYMYVSQWVAEFQLIHIHSYMYMYSIQPTGFSLDGHCTPLGLL